MDTPERFFFPHKQATGPLSPGAFTSALDRGLTQLSGREEGETLAPNVKQNDAQAPLHQEEVGQRDHMTEPADLLHSAGHSIPSGRRELLPGRLRGDEDRPDKKTPKPGNASQAKRRTDSPEGGNGQDPDDQVGRRTKAFAFYGQVSLIRFSGVIATDV